MNLSVNKTIDAKGLACPMPIVKTKKGIEEIQPGQVLEIQEACYEKTQCIIFTSIDRDGERARGEIGCMYHDDGSVRNLKRRTH